MRDFWRSIKYSSRFKGLTIILLASILLMTVFQVLQPQVLKLVFDLVGEQIKTGLSFNSVANKYWFYIGMFFALLLLQTIFSQARNYLYDLWFTRTRNELAMSTFSHVETLSLNYFEKNPAGKIKERIEKGVEDMLDTAEGMLIEILPQFIYIAIATYFLFRINIVFGLIILIGVPFFVIISFIFIKSLNEHQDHVRDAEEIASSTVIETIINIRSVKSFVTEQKHAKELSKQLENSKANTMKRSVIRVKMNFLRFMVVNISQVIIIALGTYWAITGKITLGTFVLAWSYTNQSYSPLWYLMWLVDRIQRNMRSIKRTFDILDEEPEIVDIEGAKKLKIKNGKISFDKINFRYLDEKDDILKNFSLNIDKGTAVAIVGRSGVGKSTLIKLLLRFYQPQKGDIFIDDQKINTVTQKSLRENIGVVMQDSSLFNDTAFNNIAYGNPKAKKADIIKAAKAANAHDFIMKLPQDYDTVIGERGVKLSGGEQQRINIARAILKNPPILVLDEATSSLDSESEKLIQDALWKLIKGRTTIIIAHRLSTVMRADLIVVIDKGRISEMDTHQQLVKKAGIYSKLFKIQSGGYLQ